MFKNLKKNNLIKFSYSLKLTAVCLLLLSILTVWGTIYQADNGLYAAKLKFFTSWFFLIFGFIPFPGAALVMTILFLNLVSSLLFRINFALKNIGNILTHLGIIILLLGGFFTFFFSQETVLTLKEGGSSSWSNSYNNWELSVWKDINGERIFSDVDLRYISPGKEINLDQIGINVKIENYYENALAFRNNRNNKREIINASGIYSIEKKKNELEPAGNIPGLLFKESKTGKNIVLYGGESNPTSLNSGGSVYNFFLRKRRSRLPLHLRLIDFRIEHYPGSSIVKSYESQVEIEHEGLKREVLISMNRPLRYKDFTFFQSSYQIAQNGTEYSVLAVVKNSGRLLPYISSIIIFLGMLIHFIIMLFRKKKEKTEK
ncbi:MAG: cytochrome c biogenesis protein ResB [Acidobacteriota bacterium]